MQEAARESTIINLTLAAIVTPCTRIVLNANNVKCFNDHVYARIRQTSSRLAALEALNLHHRPVSARSTFPFPTYSNCALKHFEYTYKKV